MPGLAAFALAGAAQGFGEDMLQRAQEKREEQLMKMKRGWDVEDREARFSHDESMQADRQGFELGMYGRRRGDDLSDRAHEEGREDASSGRAANVYESLFGTESGGDHGADNGLGYVGRSQFGQARLDDWSNANGTPRVSLEAFKKDKDLQKAVEEWHFRDINEKIDQDGLIDKYEGQTINGVKMTRSGIIAMAHLGGYAGAKKHLESGGEYNPADAFGTSLSTYAKKHGGLSTDMSEVWKVLADPNVDESVKDDIREKVGRGLDQSGSKNSGLTGEEWVDNGDGTETLMGRRGNSNRLEPWTRDGQPVTREKKPDKETPALSRETLRALEDDVIDPVTGEPDRKVSRRVESEIERLMEEEDLPEREAYRRALAGMRWRTTDVTNDGWGDGPRKETERVNADWEGEFVGFDYGEGLRGSVTAPERAAPPEPSMPSDPGRNTGGVASNRAQSGDETEGLPRPTSRAEYDRLPVGTRYVTPEGEVLTKKG